ncbi:deoxycytidine triphosphate deaminase [Candidatus Saccharibacteria bacterium]|nr:deoxycytidine triphosphate deaminase [Candidatus Saccharibacteria bacterium]
MSVYSNVQIKEAIKRGHIICHPLIEENIAGSSIDVTLGNWFYRTERTGVSGFYNPFDLKDVDRYFDGPYEAEIHKDWAKNNGRQLFEGIPPNQPIIVVRPGERLLGHTHEFIGIKAPGTSTLQARSTWGRNGVAVCIDAGWGDPGYINRWTLEVYNMNQHESVVLPVGERIAQMVFYETGPVEGEYKNLSGKYQTGSAASLKKLVRDWSPEQMLPKAYKDVRRDPLKIKGLKR